MRQPWYQLTDEMIEQVPELAIRLGCSEPEAGWAVVKLIQGMVKRCPDDRPPSASDVIAGSGPVPARVLAGLGGYRGDPETFATVLQCIPKPLVEPVEQGLRVRGLDRYDPLWGKSHEEAWAAWKRNNPKPNGKPTGPEPGRNRAGTGPEPGRKRLPPGPQDKDGDQDLDPKPPPPVQATVHRLPTRLSAPQEEVKKPVSPTPPRVGEPTVDLEGELRVVELWQQQRLERGLAKEKLGIAVLSRLRALIPTYRIDVWEEIFHAYLSPERSHGARYAQDDWPLAALLSPGVLERKVPPPRPPPDVLPEDRQPDTEAGRCWAQALREMRSEGKSYALTWLVKCEPLRIEAGELVLLTPDKFFVAWAEDHYAALLERLVGCPVRFVVDESGAAQA